MRVISKSIDKYFLICGDCNSVNVDFLGKFDAVITDPPFGISSKNNLNTLSGRRGVDFGLWDWNFDHTGWIARYYELLKPGGTFIIFTSYLYASFICAELSKLGANVKDLIKWEKKNPMPRNVERRYVQDTEFAVWAVKPGAKWTFNKGAAPYRRASYSFPVVIGKNRTDHPTQKSLGLMEELISVHTKRGDLVIDPFMGSGTTGVAAVKLRRRFIGVEIDRKFFKIAGKRLKETIT